MGVLGAVIGALVAGAIGSAAWAFLLLNMNTEYGLLAWAVGGLVGLGALIGSGRKMSMTNGIIAALISVVSVFGGKYYATHHAITIYSDELSTSFLADKVAEEFMDEGRDFNWPAAGEDDVRTSEEHYPVDVWAEAGDRWNKMDADGQAEFKLALRKQAEEFSESSEQQMIIQAIKDNMALLDLVFLGLAIATAFRLGSGMMGGEDEE